MRADLEAAMAAVIGSRSEHRRFFDDPKLFAESFGLEPAEIDALIEMGPDLGNLTGGFVKKREGYLRMNSARTLEMLESDGDALLSDFVSEHPMPEWQRLEAGAFGDYLVEQLATIRDESPEGKVLAEMARYEKYQHDAFWEATIRPDVAAWRSSAPSARLCPAPGRGSVTKQAIRLRAGCVIERFDWDVRIPYHFGLHVANTLKEDPCELLFFYNGAGSGFCTMRLTPLEAKALAVMIPGHVVDVEIVRKALPEGTDLDRLLNRFVWQEVCEWL